MRMSNQRYSPDTCGCRINQTFDRDANPRVISMVNMDFVCPGHAGLDDTQCNARIHAEQAMKNGFYRLVTELPLSLGLTKAVTQRTGEIDAATNRFKTQTHHDLADDIEFVWEFDANRQLKVWLVGRTFNTEQLRALKAQVAALGTEVKLEAPIR